MIASAYTAMIVSLGRFPVTDEAFFKAPGRLWSVTGRFAAPELTGVLNVQPPVEEMWAMYTPCYSFLFGAYCKLLGFGWRQCVSFDALIHVALSFLTYLATRALDRSLPCWVSLLAGAAVLPLGHPGRPDELAMCFAIAGLIPLFMTTLSRSRLFLSAILFGLTTLTSVAAGLVMGLGAVLLLVIHPGSLGRRTSHLTRWATVVAAVVIPGLGAFLLLLPVGYHQYLANAKVLISGNPENTFAFNWRHGYPVLSFTSGCVLVALGSGLPAFRANGPQAWTKLWLGPVSASLAVFALFSGRFTYMWFAGPWLVCAGAVQIAWSYRDVGFPRTAGLVLALLGGFTVGCAYSARDALVLFQQSSDQSLAYNEMYIREVIPPATVVLTDEYWWLLADRNRVYDIEFSRLRNLDEIDFVVLGANGSGRPGTPRSLRPEVAKYVAHTFQPLYDTLPRDPVTLFGMKLTHSAYGFGPLIMARMPRDADKPSSLHPLH
jgi:hypothetical protein